MTNDNSANNPVPNFYRASAADFKKIPGSPIAYWASAQLIRCFSENTSFINFTPPKKGIDTGNNDLFLRFWFEPSRERINYPLTKEEIDLSKYWFRFDKGGSFRKWFGNNDYVVNWHNNGADIRAFKGSTIRNEKYLRTNCLTWSDVTSSRFSARYSGEGAIHDNSGPCAFGSEFDVKTSLGFLSSKLSNYLLSVLNPTLHYQIGNVASLPMTKHVGSDVCNVINRMIYSAKSDWDSYETSWDFTTLPLLQPEYHQPTIRETYTKLRTHWRELALEIQRLEEENNRIFIEAYGLQDELTPEVPLPEITLTCNPHYRYKGNKSEEELEALLLTDTIKEFISYAVGCMFGRYSLDKPGLILANQGDTIDDYLQQVPAPSFMPDDDNIIPILEDEYFTDDIVGRFKEFLKATFGAESLAENLEFIAGVLSKSKKGSASPEKVIRDYFLRSFFKDHVKTYKKRPIYWLFTSGKGRGFNALVYMHRYNRETLAKMRTDYLLELEAKLDARIGMLGAESVAEKGRLGRQVKELEKYDEVLHNKSLEYIDIDLDDGVKVNYAKFEGLVGNI